MGREPTEQKAKDTVCYASGVWNLRGELDTAGIAGWLETVESSI